MIVYIERQLVTKTHQTDHSRETRPFTPERSSVQAPAHPVLRLQRTVGNRVVGRLLQPKLSVNPPNDTYEKEADRLAEQVMRMPVDRSPDGEIAKGPTRSEPARLSLAVHDDPLSSEPEDGKEEKSPIQQVVQAKARTTSPSLCSQTRICDRI